MRHHRGRVVEVESLPELDRRVRAGAVSLAGWHLQSLDLTARSGLLGRVDVAGALFLGCTFADGDESAVRQRGAVVFPRVPGVPVDTYRSRLYTAEELYDALGTEGYHATLDARAFAWSQQPPDPDLSLARALHDHAVDGALADWASGRRLVGVMGGHALHRDSPGYAAAARLARDLSRATGADGRSLVVATGGGPGAMEAANLGAWLAGESDAALEEALAMLAEVPTFQGRVDAWARAGFAVRRRWPRGGESLGVPTWHYGHEPPNPFPTAIAKYLANAVREAVLLEVCEAGLVFLPGAAGTVQEVFQDACENYYADPASVAPMVLVGRRYWTEDLPAWPLLVRLAERAERPGMADRICLVDRAEEATEVLLGLPRPGEGASAGAHVRP